MTVARSLIADGCVIKGSVGHNCTIAASLSQGAFELDWIPNGTTIGVVDQ